MKFFKLWFPWTNQGVCKRAGIMGGYEHRKRDKLKFHEFATNARRVRLESPRGDFVGGGGVEWVAPRPEWNRALQMAKSRLPSQNLGVLLVEYSRVRHSGVHMLTVEQAVKPRPHGDFSRGYGTHVKVGLHTYMQLGATSPGVSVLYILRRWKQRQREVSFFFFPLFLLASFPLPLYPFFGSIFEYFWWDLLFRDHVFEHISREGTFCRMGEKRSAGRMHPAVVCELAGNSRSSLIAMWVCTAR